MRRIHPARKFPIFRFWLCALVLLASCEGGSDESTVRQSAAVDAIIAEAFRSDDAYENLAYLCDNIGHRLSGSPQLEAAVRWTAELMRAQGFDEVREEPVMVPAWIRGEERARLVEPSAQDLHILGLGMSVGTPPGGITAELIVVGDYEELEALGADGIEGKIVLYDVPYTSYGETVRYRMSGASRAASLGAVAMLLRSVSPTSYDTPHTGTLVYDEAAPRIPAAAVTIENATMMRRMQERGDRVVCHLEMEARQVEDRPSANVVGDIHGSELPEEIVLLGGHLDSWDVGQGAQDDGAGCIIALEAAHLIKRLGLKPRRTIRVVLFTNEENGSRGGLTYRDQHAEELAQHVAAIESDAGNGPARGFRLDYRLPGGEGEDAPDPAVLADAERRRQRALALLTELATPLDELGAGRARFGYSGVDIGPIVAAGVVGLGLDHDSPRYFDVHHSPADTFDKIVKGDLDHNVACMAVMAYLLADMDERLGPAAPVERP